MKHLRRNSGGLGLKILIGMGLILAALVCAIVGWNVIPAKLAEAKQRRAEKLVEEAGVALAASDFALVRERAEAALALAPAHPRAMRMLVAALSGTSPSKALKISEALVATPEATAEDWSRHAELLQRAGRDSDAVAAQRQGNSGDIKGKPASGAGTLQAARDLHERYPSDRGTALMYARLLFDQNAVEGAAALESVSYGTDQEALQALRLLVASKQTPASARALAAERLAARPSRAIEDELALASGRIAERPGARAELAQALLDGSLPKGKPGDLGAEEQAVFRQIAKWLNSERCFDLSLKILPVEEAKGTPELLEICCDALIGAGRAGDAYKLANAAKAMPQGLDREVLLARCAAAMGDAEQASRHWNLAFRVARDSEGRSELIRVIAMSGVSKPGASEAELLRDYASAMFRRGNTYGMKVLSEELVERFPGNSDYLNNRAYFRMLLKAAQPDDFETVERLGAEMPLRAEYVTTLALARLRRDHLPQALEVVRPLVPLAEQLSDADKAIVASVLAAGGEARKGVLIRHGINVSALLPEELELLDEHVGAYAVEAREFATRVEKLRELGETGPLLVLLRSRVETYPEEAAYQREYQYLRTLTGSGLSAAGSALRGLIAEDPSDWKSRVLLAFVELKLGNAENARREMDAAEWKEGEATIQERIIRAAVDASTGQHLIEEERAFLLEHVLSVPEPASPKAK